MSEHTPINDPPGVTTSVINYGQYSPSDIITEVYEYDELGRIIRKTVTKHQPYTPQPWPYQPYQFPGYQQWWQSPIITC